MTIIEDTPVNTSLLLYVQNYVFMNSVSGNSNNIQNYTAKRGNAYSTKVAKASDGTIRTYCEEDIQSIQTSIEYSDLVTLRDNGELIPGIQYRITDFVTTTTTTDTMSAGHQFDIIVTASSNNTLNENAKAKLSSLTGVDTYFSNCNIDSWEIKYCLDNDTNRFEWADATNGKGVIYYMKDNGGNEACYDFKNIMFKNPSNADDTTWYFTFTNTDGSDASLLVDSCYGNKIGGYYSGLQLKLNNIIFNCINGSTPSIYDIVFGYNCYDIIFGDDCYSNTFGNNCYSNTFGDRCQCNIFGDSCQFNTFGYQCSDNTFGEGCQYNTFGNNCRNNTFGNILQNNTFGYSCYGNTFGNSCQRNTFGNDCSYNTFEGYCQYNTFGNSCQVNTFGNSCYKITFSTISGDANCYFMNINFESGCMLITMTEDTPYDESLQLYVQNYVFMNSASGTLFNNIQNYTVKRGNTYSTKVAKASDGTVKTYCEEDIQSVQTSIAYSDLVTLRDNAKLIPGIQYRITDYVTTTTTTNTMSAGHQFDVIVTAVSDNTLNEDAKAALHDGDTYFANCDIDSWELKYCIDNNTNRFEWADTTNGKGVIYYMKDNGGNECQYDFKNIMFKNPSNADDTTWYYTFTNRDGNDLSLSVNLCYGNKIDGYYNGLQLKLNNIIFNCIDGRRQIV